jgi:ATP-binding protein involved in chromosome partitioning
MENNLNNNIKNIIIVTSGKGGVGKSTVSVNIAVSLAKKGHKTGLLDADIYGPSIPIMMGLMNQKPQVEELPDGKQIFTPYEKYGVKVSSIGFFIHPEQAMVWRGPLAASVFTQLLNDNKWGDLDYLIIDAPPGTGDIQLSLVQSVPVTGAVIVTTPQEVAVVDARKAVNMFKNPEIKVPILGLVENMSWFTPKELPENKYYIFGKNGGADAAEKLHVRLLGQIPIIQGICEDADNGTPSVLEDEQYGEIFGELTDNLIEIVDIRNSVLKPTEKVQTDPNAEGCGA